MTHRGELENLIGKARAQGYGIEVLHGPEGHIDVIRLVSRANPTTEAVNGSVTLSPLAFAEWARGRV